MCYLAAISISEKGQDGENFLKGIKEELETRLGQETILIVKRSVEFL